MASEKILEQKKKEVVEVSQKLKDAVAGVVIDYKGINVADDTAFRRAMRKAGVEYSVVKNSILRFAVDNADLSDLKGVLEGTTAVALSKDDVVAPAKVVCEFAKTNQNIKIKAGFYDGNVVGVDTITALSKIPPKNVLLSKMLGSLNAPVTSLALALKAIAEKQAS